MVLLNNGAGEGNRTLMLGLEGRYSTIELHPRIRFCVGVLRFELRINPPKGLVIAVSLYPADKIFIASF